MIKHISLPITEEQARNLHIGDSLLLSGTMITGRDAAHKLMLEKKPEFLKPYLENSIIYHCGPVVKKEGDSYRFIAAGPTTSIREEPYQSAVMAHYKVRGVIGKGGMGDKTLQGLKETGAVYLHATGGAAPLLAQCVTQVKEVFFLEEFGVPEAMWVIEVKDFPVLVTMDSHGGSLHKELGQSSLEQRNRLFENL